MSLRYRWEDDSPLPHGEPIRPEVALAIGILAIALVLALVVRGGTQLVVGVAPLLGAS